MNIGTVIVFAVKNYSGKAEFLSGRTRGDEHRNTAIRLIEDNTNDTQPTVIFDFKSIGFASASYLKATLLKLAQEPLHRPDHPDVFVFPVVRNLSDEIRDELAIVCQGERLPCLEIHSDTKDVLILRMFGEPEKTIRQTFSLLQQLGRGTASEIAALAPDEGINLTAWNNRLAELYRLRLVKRFRQGKFWKYEPIAKEVVYG